jgi:beta-phosphoglucomutase-like phosphatase (HAD superfamily)
VGSSRRNEPPAGAAAATAVPAAARMDQLALDTLAMHWREALDGAEETLDALSHTRRQLGLPAHELGRRINGLRAERTATEVDLERLARVAHLPVHRHLTGPRATSARLGLGPDVRGCVFDLDGVLTPSSELHVEAWQRTFDELLARHDAAAGTRLDAARPFGRNADYHRYLEGKPRLEGVHAFLASRGIRLPDGSADDPPGSETAFGIANRKNELLGASLRERGMRAYDESLVFLELAQEARLRCAVVSASANTSAILGRAGLRFLVDELVDGNVLQAEHLRPKPAPDSVLEACRRLELSPAEVATFETTPAGVAAGRAAGVERVVVVRRESLAPGADAWGADRVVADLGELIGADLV